MFANGRVGVACTLDSVHAKLSVGNRDYATSGYNISLLSSTPTDSAYNIGVEGWAVPSSPIPTGRSYGVRGVAGNCTSGYNYGILGRLLGSNNGAGVFGTISNELGKEIDGKYAGYFDGDVCVDGVTKALLCNPFDDSNLTSYVLSETAAMALLSRYTPCFTYDVYDNPHLALSIDDYDDMPCLVVEDAMGTEYPNYTEVIPLLVACVNVLQDRVDAMQQSNSSTFDEGETTAMAVARQTVKQGCVLHQNAPNPFGTGTIVKYSIPQDAANAQLIIFDMQGTMLRQIPVSPSGDSVTLNGTDFPTGMYMYSLVVNGKEMDTKRMIITK